MDKYTSISTNDTSLNSEDSIYSKERDISSQNSDNSDSDMEQPDQFFCHETKKISQARNPRLKSYEEDESLFLKNISRQNYEDTSNIRKYLLERISLFKKKMPARCRKELISNFNIFIDLLMNILPHHSETFKLVRVDALVDAILLIAANHVNMGKTEFLDCLTMETRLIPSRVTEIKKFACYRKLKLVFDQLTNKGIKILMK